MSLTSDTMTPADIAAVCGNNNRNNDGMFGNDWAWIVILLLFGWGGRGFGGFGGFGGGNGGGKIGARWMGNDQIPFSIDEVALAICGLKRNTNVVINRFIIPIRV